jgi:alanine dehydrogenase
MYIMVTYNSASTSQGLSIVSESVCKEIFGRSEAFTAVERVFASMAKGNAYNFPVVRESIGHADALYGFKSGFDRVDMILGLKSGGYWPGNVDKNLTNHQSTIFLFDPETGKLKSVVGGNYLTALRTAASSAVSIFHLARKNAKILGIVGAGHQSAFQLRAAIEQRGFEKVIAWNRHPDNLLQLAAVCGDLGLPFEIVNREKLCAKADVIITITSAFEPLLMKDWIKPGTHIACMGTDTKGKQEVDPLLLATATVFTDEITQSVSIGEAQHAIASCVLKANKIVSIGDVINGDHPGRQSDDEVTLFDGTGVGLQDLVVASAAVQLAEDKGLVNFINM